jgi:hypothetical protein
MGFENVPEDDGSMNTIVVISWGLAWSVPSVSRSGTSQPSVSGESSASGESSVSGEYHRGVQPSGGVQSRLPSVFDYEYVGIRTVVSALDPSTSRRFKSFHQIFSSLLVLSPLLP